MRYFVFTVRNFVYVKRNYLYVINFEEIVDLQCVTQLPFLTFIFIENYVKTLRIWKWNFKYATGGFFLYSQNSELRLKEIYRVRDNFEQKMNEKSVKYMIYKKHGYLFILLKCFF